MSNQPILIVDDDLAMRKALAEALGREGYKVKLAANGIEGLKEMNSGKCSMVISDLKMPGMDGLEFLRQVKGNEPAIPVLLMSAYGQIEDAVEAMKVGAVDFISKPFSLETIEEIVKKTLVGENPEKQTNEGFIANHSSMKRIVSLVQTIADSRATVMLQGESGTGKEMLARFIHECSKRSKGSFVAVNCASLPENLLESELFGHEKGAFSGAVQLRKGKFELADSGTILLDEISEMNFSLQAKLLRVLQEFEVDRLGGNHPIPVDVRVITTTNRDLKKMVNEGTFREDLYYRINVFPIYIPPLRKRKEDIENLARHFCKKHAERNSKVIPTLTQQAVRRLLDYDWPGNVRQLENVIERAVLVTKENEIQSMDLLLETEQGLFEQNIDIDDKLPGLNYEDDGEDSSFVGTTIHNMERDLILSTLDKMNGNRTHASKVLGISLRTLRNKLREYREKGIIPLDY